jgi:hypothetical protein
MTTQKHSEPTTLSISMGGVPRIDAPAARIRADRPRAPLPQDGGVTSVQDGGGRVLNNAGIVLIYWGTEWTNPATSPSQVDFTTAFKTILSGPWGSKLPQYRGASVGNVVKVDVNTSTEPAAQFTDPEISAMIESRITSGAVPPPTTDLIYLVVMPQGHSSGDTNFAGQHQFTTFGVNVVWAWVTNDGTLTGPNSAPKIFCHEVAEACTDPEFTGILLTSKALGSKQEIGDVCNNTFSVVNGIAEEAYWSVVDNSCVLPLPAAGVFSITVNPDILWAGGASATGTVTLNQTPPGDIVVSLVSSDPQVILSKSTGGPPITSLTVDGGSATFAVTALPTAAAGWVLITAIGPDGTPVATTVTIGTGGVVISLPLYEYAGTSYLLPGQTVTGTVFVETPGGLITLTHDDRLIPPVLPPRKAFVGVVKISPATIQLSGGDTSGTFALSGTSTGQTTITANYLGNSATATVFVSLPFHHPPIPLPGPFPV